MPQDSEKRVQKPYTVYFNEDELELLEKIDDARILKGMSKKGFFLYGIANLVPELAPDIIRHLTKRPYSKNTAAVIKDAHDATEHTND
jgi:hypothetical protein